MTRTKIPLDSKNRILRVGLGKNEDNWFFRIDLWWYGWRWTK